MLKQVRNALKGVVAWFVVVLLILAFAAWGVPEMRSFTQNSALRVGKVNFSTNQILNEFNRAMVNRRIESEGAFTREDAIEAGLPDQIVMSMATRSALEQEAAKLGLVMPRAAVREYLQSNSQYHNPRTGKFDNEVLTRMLQNYNMSVRQFETQMRADLLRQQLVDSISAGVPAPEPMIDGLLLREVERRDVAYLTVTEEMSGIPEEPTPVALQAYYQENPNIFTVPEYRKFSVIALRESEFREGLPAPEEDLRKVYEAQKSRLYEKSERRTIYQLTYDSEAAAIAAVAALEQATPFEKLASDQGLSLEAVTFTDIERGDLLDPTVAEEAFSASLTEGAITAPIKSLFGWTVVQVAGIVPPETQSFEDVRDDLESQYLEQDTRKRIFDTVEAIEAQRDTGALLPDAAKAVGVDIQAFGPVDSYSFGPGSETVANIPAEFLSEAFLLEEGAESEAVDLDDGAGYFFISVEEITAPQLMAFDAVADEVESRWRQQERNKRISNTLNQIRDAVAAGATLAKASEPLNRTPIVEKIRSKDAGEVFSEETLARIFAADKGATVTGPAGSGSAQIIAVVQDIEFNRAAIGPGEEIAFQQFVGYQLDQELLDAYITVLRDDYGVITNAEQIDQLFADGQ